jgi:hypothetical protein
MTASKNSTYKNVAVVLVLLMALLQCFYAIYAYIDPAAFSVLRGTDLIASDDADWVRIYASRTLFVALVIALLLYLRSYEILKWVSLFGIVMPVVDATLAYHSQAPTSIVMKHVATIIYLLITFWVLRAAVKVEQSV